MCGHLVKGRFSATGPYAIVRHPLYIGSLLIICGILFQLNDFMNWMVILPAFAVFHGAAIIYEERSLEKSFGRQWQLYRASVPALIPRLPDRSSASRTRGWSWRAYFNTCESTVTPLLLCMPLVIELLLEDFVFESILGL